MHLPEKYITKQVEYALLAITFLTIIIVPILIGTQSLNNSLLGTIALVILILSSFFAGHISKRRELESSTDNSV